MRFEALGCLDYQAAWQYQEQLFQATVDQKFANRKLPPEQQVPTRSHLLFCEHPHVYTLGKSGKREHLLVSEADLARLGAQFYPINRGGDITYHGPGQLVGYPILDLDQFSPDIHAYLRNLESIFIRILADYGLSGERSPGETGVWLGLGGDSPRKILALGVRASRWVTMHGWAFNVNTDLRFFEHIVPCGIADKGVTSLQAELGHAVPMAEIEALALRYFAEQFSVRFYP